MRYLTSMFIILLLQVSVYADTLYVRSSLGTKGVQDAIDRAQTYDVIYLQRGRFTGQGIIINKAITLTGDQQAIIDGSNEHTLLTIELTAARISGLHFINTGYSSVDERCAIKLLSARGCIIENNTINEACFGIMLMKTTHCVIENNVIQAKNIHEQRSGNGIHGWQSDSLTIQNNKIEGHRDGIYFEFVTKTGVYRNQSTHNLRYGIHFMFSSDDEYVGNTFAFNGSGVAVMFSHNVSIRKNIFADCMGGAAYGILLKEINDTQITDNAFLRNTNGIYMEGTNRISLQRNEFTANGWACRIQASCSAIFLNNNDFVGNTFDIATNGSLTANNFNGNYWDKYEGYDLNEDQVGDVPFSPVSMYGVIIEQMPYAILLYRSLMVYLLDRSEKVMPGMTSEQIKDKSPRMHTALQ